MTLLEAMVALAIMAGLMTVCCEVFLAGSSVFKVGDTRISLQQELRKIVASLRRDLLNTSFQSVSDRHAEISVLERPGVSAATRLVARDSICFVALSDANPPFYDATRRLHRWDSYLLFSASDTPDSHELVRKRLVDPHPSTDTEALRLDAPFLAAPPVMNRDVRTLSNHLEQFTVKLDKANQLVGFSLQLRGDVGRREQGPRSTAEILEAQESIRPVNTYPKL